jgi:hypothetical protein
MIIALIIMKNLLFNIDLSNTNGVKTCPEHGVSLSPIQEPMLFFGGQQKITLKKNSKK